MPFHPHSPNLKYTLSHVCSLLFVDSAKMCFLLHFEPNATIYLGCCLLLESILYNNPLSKNIYLDLLSYLFINFSMIHHIKSLLNLLPHFMILQTIKLLYAYNFPYALNILYSMVLMFGVVYFLQLLVDYHINFCLWLKPN